MFITELQKSVLFGRWQHYHGGGLWFMVASGFHRISAKLFPEAFAVHEIVFPAILALYSNDLINRCVSLFRHFSFLQDIVIW